MTEQHECEWHFYEESADGAFCVRGFGCRLSRDEAESRLNEYETLRKATERLSAEDAKLLAASAAVIVGDEHTLVVAGYAYADILEGK